MPLSRLEHLRHMLDEADYLIAQKQGLGKERFLKDATLKRAFVRSIEIIGEASKKVRTEMDCPATGSGVVHSFPSLLALRVSLKFPDSNSI